MATYAKLIYNGRINTVALIEGLDSEELVSLLKTVFNIDGKVVGLLAEKGLVLPISLVCKSPQIIPNSVCKILVSGGAPEQSQAQVSSQASGRSVASEATNDSQAASDDDNDSTLEIAIQEIVRFLEALRDQSFLSATQFQLLYALLSQNSTLLFAAYSVAVSASDSEYFAEICKDLANSLTTEQGRSACEAQDEVLQVCDQLYINSRITENQLLYLRHLVLIRDEEVASVYDEFQEHQSVPLLAKSLYDLANSHPFQQMGSASEKSVGTENEEEDDEDDDATESSAGGSRKKSMANISKGLTGVISLMSRAGVISKTEANVLFEMVEEENDYVIAAYELYERDRNLDDLQDTLLRCVRLEIRKRVTDIQEKELADLQRERQFQSQYDNDDEDEEDEGDFRGESEEEESPDDDEDKDDFGLENITLDSILQSLNVENIWKDMVPDAFVQAVFISVIRGYLEVNQAKACCDLFMARYDLVLAAWEVYTVQRDTTDFVDTLRRAVKDLNLSSLHSKAKTSSSSSSASAASQSSPARASPAKAAAPAPAPAAASTDTQELQDRKNEAMKAVMGAKRELLKHSLEMMVKQGITNAERASDLYARYLAGDKLIDAAIESYANDRDVAEFLDTLQILCNNSKEDIEALMHAASQEDNNNNDDDEEEQAPNSPSNEDIALLQITDIVKEMLKNDMIGPSVAEAFQGLIKSRDSRLIAAYNQYLVTKNGADLVDTLLRTVIASVEGVAKTAPSSSSSAASKPTSAPKPAANDSSEGLLDPSDQKTVVEILLRANAVTKEQFEHLNSLIDKRNPELARVFTRYEQTKDVHQLINTLKEFNQTSRSSPAKAAASAAAGDLEDDEEEESEEDGEDQDDDDEDFDEDDADLIETRFMHIVQNMKLSDLETAALRLAIAEGNPLIANAMDRFKIDMDENDLIDSLRGAAKSTIHRMILSSRAAPAEDDNEDDDEDDEEEEEGDDDDNDEEDDDEEDDNDKPNAPVNPYSKYVSTYIIDDGEDDEDEEEEGDDDEEEAEEDEEDEDDDEENFSGNSLITSQAARDQVFPILVGELVKENIMSSSAGKIIMHQFANGNPVISSALDVYDQESDMAQLVDTLQQLVENLESN